MLAGVCWTLAVGSGIFTVGAFAGGGVLCLSGHPKSCPPRTWILVVGVVVTIALGIAGALLWKPKPKRPAGRFPWDYPE